MKDLGPIQNLVSYRDSEPHWRLPHSWTFILAHLAISTKTRKDAPHTNEVWLNISFYSWCSDMEQSYVT